MRPSIVITLGLLLLALLVAGSLQIFFLIR